MLVLYFGGGLCDMADRLCLGGGCACAQTHVLAPGPGVPSTPGGSHVLGQLRSALSWLLQAVPSGCC